MTDPDTMKTTIESAVAKHLDEIIANDKHRRIRKPDAFRWLTLNNLRLALARPPATELAELASLSGAERRFPRPPAQRGPRAQPPNEQRRKPWASI